MEEDEEEEDGEEEENAEGEETRKDEESRETAKIDDRNSQRDLKWREVNLVEGKSFHKVVADIYFSSPVN